MHSVRTSCATTSQASAGSISCGEGRKCAVSRFRPTHPLGMKNARVKSLRASQTKSHRLRTNIKISCINGWEDLQPADAKEMDQQLYPWMQTRLRLHEKTSGRVIAIGDLHGDITQTIRCLQLAGVVDPEAVKPSDVHWIGGDTTVVQLGDVLDRGDDEIGILLLLRKLAAEAQEAGGALHMLNGNHEVLNVAGDFRYVTPGAFTEADIFTDILDNAYGEDNLDEGVPCFRMKTPGEIGVYSTEELCERRVKLFAPGGLVAQQLANNRIVLVVNDTCFVHGGLMPRHIEFGLEHLNVSMSRWMRGEAEGEGDIQQALDLAAGSRSSVVWNRTFSAEQINPREKEMVMALTKQVLEGLSKECGVEVKRMVMGHTVQRLGINSELDDLLWRIDIGVSSGILGAPPEVLEINGDEVKVLRYSPHEVQSPIGNSVNVNTEFEELSCSVIDHSYLLRSNL